MLFVVLLSTGLLCRSALFSITKSTYRSLKFLKKIIAKQKNFASFKKVLFPPDDNVLPLLTGLIQAESECVNGKIDVTAYQFSSQDIADSLRKAYEEGGIPVRIVSDVNALGGRYDYIRELHNAGIPANIYPAVGAPKKYTLMHNKFIIFHALACVWTGSMNFTSSGMNNNQENIIVFKDHELVRDYSQQFERLLKRSTKL